MYIQDVFIIYLLGYILCQTTGAYFMYKSLWRHNSENMIIKIYKNVLIDMYGNAYIWPFPAIKSNLWFKNESITIIKDLLFSEMLLYFSVCVCVCVHVCVSAPTHACILNNWNSNRLYYISHITQKGNQINWEIKHVFKSTVLHDLITHNHWKLSDAIHS